MSTKRTADNNEVRGPWTKRARHERASHTTEPLPGLVPDMWRLVYALLDPLSQRMLAMTGRAARALVPLAGTLSFGVCEWVHLYAQYATAAQCDGFALVSRVAMQTGRGSANMRMLASLALIQYHNADVVYWVLHVRHVAQSALDNFPDNLDHWLIQTQQPRVQAFARRYMTLTGRVDLALFDEAIRAGNLPWLQWARAQRFCHTELQNACNQTRLYRQAIALKQLHIVAWLFAEKFAVCCPHDNTGSDLVKSALARNQSSLYMARLLLMHGVPWPRDAFTSPKATLEMRLHLHTLGYEWAHDLTRFCDNGPLSIEGIVPALFIDHIHTFVQTLDILQADMTPAQEKAARLFTERFPCSPHCFACHE